jgi:hypothetical protein
MSARIVTFRPCASAADFWQKAGIEPALDDLLNDPIVALVMRRDNVSQDALFAIVTQAQTALRRPLCRRFA